MAATGAEEAGLSDTGTLEEEVGNFGPRLIRDDAAARAIGSLAEPRALSNSIPLIEASSCATSGAAPAAGQRSPPPPPRRASSSSSGTEDLQMDPELGARTSQGASESCGSADTLAEGELSLKIKAFKDQREDEQRRMLRIILWLSFHIFSVGVLTAVVGLVIGYVLSERYFEGAFMVIAYSTIMLAPITLSCCPYDLFDFDDVCCNSPKSVATVLLFASIVNIDEVRHFPHLPAVKFLCMLLIGVTVFSAARGRRLPPWWPSTTAAQSWYFSFDGIAWAGIHFFHDQNDRLDISENPSRILGLINFVYGVTAFLGWFYHRFRYPDVAHGTSRRFYVVFYYWSLWYSIRTAFYGAAWMASPREGAEDPVAGAMELARGLAIMMPVCAVVFVGRNHLFKLVAHSFDTDGDRQRRDGAFVAELLGNIHLQVGQTWWIHREEENDDYPPFDPRRCWQRGIVTEVVSQSDFVVNTSELASFSGKGSNRRASMSIPSDDSATVRVTLPSTGQGESKEDLLLQAQKDLRCVEFANLSLELMRRVDSRNNPELQAAWYALSRPVRPGESIDYFISNSWYDNPERKWKRLVEVAVAFQERHGRYPTFWLDKICIDQQKITDGLKVLPVYVMACTKLLALCGDTYLSRLWCIWELFLVFAFMSEEAALERVEFVFLGSHEEGMKMLDSMERFHVKAAHCYDPNEEARLLQVIGAVGTTLFNSQVSNMARKTKARLVNLEAKRPTKGTAVRKVTSSMSRTLSRSKSPGPASFTWRTTGSTQGSTSDFTSELSRSETPGNFSV